MKTKTLGLGLSIVGLIMMIYTGFNYVTTEKVVDLGPIEINTQTDHPVQWSPIIGGIFFIGGILIISLNKQK
jgi:drug/metabolite transporter (DMT)-like permease